MKKLVCLLLAALFAVTACSCGDGGSGSSAEAPSSESGGVSEEKSMDTEIVTADRSGVRRLVSLGCEYKSEISGAAAAEGDVSLTEGKLETVGLTPKGFTAYKPAGKSFGIDIDLGAEVPGLCDFELYWMCKSGVCSEPLSLAIYISNDGSDYTKAADASVPAQPKRGEAWLGCTAVESESSYTARYVRFVITPRGGDAVYIQEASVWNYSGGASVEEDVPVEIKLKAPDDLAESGIPYAAYSFVTLMPLRGATDAEWDEYFDNMQNAGIEGLIVLNSSGFDGGFTPNETWNKCLSMCEQRGMKVFMGLNMAESGVEYCADADARAKLIAGGVKAAGLVYSAYRKSYPNALYGWYLSLELNNGVFTKYPDGCAELLNGYLDGLDALDPSMPLLLSPFSAAFYGTASALAPALKKVFAATHFRSIDIYCPQDSVGAELTALADSASYFAVAKEAADQAGIHLWANCENFVIKSAVPGVDDTVAAPVSRFVRQMQAAAPYVEKFTTFTFEAYAPDKVGNYTIYTDNEYFYDKYIEYLNSGSIPDETAPGEITVSSENAGDGYAYITLSLDTPTYHIGSFSVIRDGEQRTFTGMKFEEKDGKTYFCFRDKVEKGSAVYEITAYDYSSKPSQTKRYGYNCEVEEVFVYDIDRTAERHIVSVGKAYTSTKPTHSNGDNGGELTDGKYGRSNDFGDAAWCGLDGSAPWETVIDLGERTEAIADITLSCLSGGLGSIYLPKSVEYYISDDGVTFVSIGRTDNTMSGDGTLYAERCGLELEKGVACRYVKVVAMPNGWCFLDEVEVAVYGD